MNDSKLIWITGLSGSGKSTIGKAVYERLKYKHINTVFLDGDSFREVLGNDLGHTQKDRLENAKRIHRMCKFLISQNINVVCATMSLFKEIHELNRNDIQNYYEVLIDCDINELITRNQKGIYSKALNGEDIRVAGINLEYDKPEFCDLIINNTQKDNIENKVQLIFNLIKDSI